MIIDFWVAKLNKSVKLDVSEDGKTVRDVERDYVYVQDLNSDGYPTVRVRHVRTTVHRLVAEAFLGKRPNGLVVDHIDRNKQNNHYTNLRYVTLSENSKNISDETLNRIKNMYKLSKSRESQIKSCSKSCRLTNVLTNEIIHFRSILDASRFISKISNSSVSIIRSNLTSGWNCHGFKFEYLTGGSNVKIK